MKRVLKRIIKNIYYRPRGAAIGPDSFFLRPFWIYNTSRVKIGARVKVGRFSTFNPIVEYEGVAHSGSISIGDDVYIGGYCQLHSMFPMEVGNGSVLSEYVYISDTSHGMNPHGGLIMSQPLHSKGPVKIGKNVFIGFGASILPGVTVGDHAVVGARSVVTRDVPAYSMVAGMPAKVVKIFDHAQNEWISAEGRR